MNFFTATNGYLAGVFLAIAVDALVLGDFGVPTGVETVVLVVGSFFAIGGLIGIVVRELVTHPERRLVGRTRDAIEVLLPFVGAVALVIVVWSATA